MHEEQTEISFYLPITTVRTKACPYDPQHQVNPLLMDNHLNNCLARRKFLKAGEKEHVCEFHRHHIFLKVEQLIHHELFDCLEPKAVEMRKKQQEKRDKERKARMLKEVREEARVFAPSPDEVLKMWEQQEERDTASELSEPEEQEPSIEAKEVKKKHKKRSGDFLKSDKSQKRVRVC